MLGRFPASAYDNWRLNGNWHRCICGARWSDSDGGPCHVKCEDCGAVTHVDDLEDGCCEDCVPMECAGGCGEELPRSSEDWLYEDVCKDCAATLVDIVEAELEEVLEHGQPGDDDLIGQAVKARLAGEALPEKALKAVEAWKEAGA